ncbi:MAG: acyltransferase family protein [Chitinophagaceae bacterium]|nr:acyltransferase family protein [Rubrivivax sp.]
MNTAPATERLFFLDWLRIAAFALLVLYHVGMYYVTWDWHVKSPFAAAVGPVLEPAMLLSTPWRLALLFLISGAASSLMLARARPGFLGQRSWRLLLPLLAGMFVIVPPQAYFEVVHKLRYGGSYIDFMGLYLQGYGGFCREGNCLVLPTWNHLWFVAYLWVYTLALWALSRLAPQALDRAGAWLASARRSSVLLVLPVLWLAFARQLLLDHFPSTHNLVVDFHNHALFGSMFLAGALLARAPGVWQRLAGWRWRVLPVALVGWALLALYFDSYRDSAPPDALRQAQRVLFASVQWSAVVAALGFAFVHWNADHPWRRYLVDAVFPVYILHQTLIVLLSQMLLPLGWRPWAEGPVLVAGTFALSLAGYEVVRRIGFLRPWFGLALRQGAAARNTRQTLSA